MSVAPGTKLTPLIVSVAAVVNAGTGAGATPLTFGAGAWLAVTVSAPDTPPYLWRMLANAETPPASV